MICPYGRCTMVNLCKGSHCVRSALEKDGWKRDADGQLERSEHDPCRTVKNDEVDGTS